MNNIWKINFMLVLFSLIFSSSSAIEFYQIKIYHLNNKNQEEIMDKFLKDAYIPALHNAGISKVGVFKPIGMDTIKDKYIVVFIPFKSLQQFEDLPQFLEKDSKYNISGKEYIDASYDKPTYVKIESIILKALSFMPQFEIPVYSNSPSERIYELRSYQSPTEKLFNKKIEMFNEGGEIKLFHALGFNAVFYAEVLSGTTMPNMMYMTTFSDLKSQTEHWESFRISPDWKEMSGLGKYKNTVSASAKYLLYPTDYSEI